MNAPASARREFLKQSGALVVAFALAPAMSAQPAANLPGSLATNRMLDGWLRINADGTITLFTGKVELGQGILTALAQIAAEELDVSYERIRIASGDTSRTPNEGYTAGSQSIEYGGTAVRYAAAEARAILLAAAADKFGAPVDRLVVNDGAISAGGSKVTYWELTEVASLKREATAQAKPKPANAHKVVGKSMPRRDLPAKVFGTPAYVQDLRLPGMVFGRVVRPSSYRARLISADEAAVRSMPGVLAVVRDGSFLAVAAEREEEALAAAGALRASAKWNENPDLPPSQPQLFEFLQQMPSLDTVVNEKSGPTPGTHLRTLEAIYTRPFQSHGAMGPSCAVAQMKDKKLTVWTHSQGVFPLRRDLSKVLRMAQSDITVVHMEGAGCYGHDGADDAALDAALLARATNGRPVKLQWMRDDEFAWEPYGSAMVVKMRARLDDGGRIIDWRHDVWSHPHSTRPGSTAGSTLLAGWHIADPVAPGIPENGPQPAGAADRNAVPGYEFPNQRITLHFLRDMPIRTSALRTLGAYANVFALESMMDEAALAANADPVEFRLRHLKDERGRAVIETAARKAGWKPGQKGDGVRGRGIGYAKYKNLSAYVAVIADVEVDRQTGKVRVSRAVAAVDAGLAINPDGIINQIEGGIIQSTSWTLKEEVRFDRQRIIMGSWADYPILTFPEVPAVDVTLINRPEEKPLGTGEGAQGPTVAAIANALCNATGVRIRDLPFARERVKAAFNI